jgi:RNA polymerase sigma factor (sigma-70 family)
MRERAMRERARIERSVGLGTLCRSEILSVEEERRLFNRLRSVRAKALRSHSKNSNHARSRFADEAAEIRNRIVECNLRLVVSVAKHYAAPERSLEDLVSDATLPLIRCVESFDSRRGTRFSTYATRALTNLFAKIRRQDGRRRSRFSQSENWWRVPATEGRTTASERLIRAEALGRLGDCLARLSPREQVLVAERFGLTGDRCPRTFRELGARHGLSKERVRVITCEAISRLRQSLDEPAP